MVGKPHLTMPETSQTPVAPDVFAILEMEPRPWLDPDDLKTRYRTLSEAQHPDRAGSQAAAGSADLTRAFQVLSSPAQRLRALLQREPDAPNWRTGQVPAEMVDLFMAISADLKIADDLIARLDQATTQLSRALLTPQILGSRQKLEAHLAKVRALQEEADTDLRALDDLWHTDRSQALKALPALYQKLSYLAKWRDQLRQRMATLIF